MIRVRRGSKPEILVQREQTWTDEYRRLRAGDAGVPAAAATRYRHPAIKAQCQADAHEKCIYCESQPLAVSPGAVEHLQPKSKFPDLIVAWENLAFVCPECNTTKGDYYDEAQPVVDPFTEDPADFIRFAGPMVLEQPGSQRGIVTIRKLELDRGKLVSRRAEHLREIQALLNTWALMEDGSAKIEVEAEIRRRAEDSGEYAAATRAFLALSEF
jgi:uncharacterized protein (TIGR02646 family)